MADTMIRIRRQGQFYSYNVNGCAYIMHGPDLKSLRESLAKRYPYASVVLDWEGVDK